MRLPERIEVDIDAADRDVAVVSIRFWFSRIEVMGRLIEVEGALHLVDAHIQKSGPVRLTPLLIDHIAQLLMEELGYVGIHIAGAVRTSGAGKGSRPRPVRFARRD